MKGNLDSDTFPMCRLCLLLFGRETGQVSNKPCGYQLTACSHEERGAVFQMRLMVVGRGQYESLTGFWGLFFFSKAAESETPKRDTRKTGLRKRRVSERKPSMVWTEWQG